MIQSKQTKAVSFAPNKTERSMCMTRVLLCDDDPVFLESLQKRLRELLKKDGMLYSFTDPMDMPTELMRGCDIFFLDIDFAGKGYTGLDAAKSIRQVNPDGVILFLTNYIEYAPAGYEVQAFRYLLKSDAQQKLVPALQDALAQRSQHQETVQLTVAGEKTVFFLADVLYIEAQGHAALLHSEGKSTGQYRLYTTLTNLEQKLADRGFLRVQKSFLVNMRRIRRLRCDLVTLDNGTELPVSEKMYGELKKKYISWKGQG